MDAFDAIWGRRPGAAPPEAPAARLDALEGPGGELKRRSQQEAKAIRDEAYADARRIRSNTYQAVREDIATASETSRVFVERFGQAMSELRELVDTMRACADKLAADLATVQADESETPAAAGVAEPEPPGRGPAPSGPVPPHAPDPPPTASSAVPESPPEVPPRALTPSDPPVPSAATRASEWDRARLLALNMALNGASREEADRYLAENLRLEERSALLDDVFDPTGRGGGAPQG